VQLLAYTRCGTDRAGTRLGIQTDRGIADLTDALGVGELLRHGGFAADELAGRAGPRSRVSARWRIASSTRATDR